MFDNFLRSDFGGPFASSGKKIKIIVSCLSPPHKREINLDNLRHDRECSDGKEITKTFDTGIYSPCRLSDCFLITWLFLCCRRCFEFDR